MRLNLRSLVWPMLLCMIFSAGCGQFQQPIKVGKSESAADAAARVAEALPSDEAEEFLNAAEMLAMHYGTKPATRSELRINASVRAIDGKTPRQIIAEYSRLTPEEKSAANTIMQSQRTQK